ncbi:MAG TPA: TolC family protein [Bryobacteraceae bacterium]|nr:TolC family protein [Bryobacteraceae bacterium]
MMRPFKLCVSLGLISCGAAFAQSEVGIVIPPARPVVGGLIAPFHTEKRLVPPVRLTDSPRIDALIRGGNLYLSAQDVIALVLENNLDIAVQRYSPFLAREVVRRTQGGGFLRAVDTPLITPPASVSTAGVSINANGLAGGTGLGSTGAIVTQIGPPPPSLDPQLSFNVQLGHSTTPETNVLLNQTSALTNNYRQVQFAYSQQFPTGTSAILSFFDYRGLLNSGIPQFNPFLSGYIDLTVNQNLLQGFGRAVNNRDIRVAQNNVKWAELQLKLQVATTVAAALDLYWYLVSFNDAVRIKQQSLETAQSLFEGNKQRVAAGALPAIEITRAAAQVSASQEDLLVAQTNVAQQEIVLKNVLSRRGVERSALEDVHIIPLDHIEIPPAMGVRPVQDLIQEALAGRIEIAQNNLNVENQKILLKGTRNNLLPNLQSFFELTNNGLAGAANALYTGCCGPPYPQFLGGNGSVLAQIFRRNFPNYSAGLSLNIAFRNRQAQADFVTDELQLRQYELQLQRASNQVRVDVKTELIGLQQAHARYESAAAARGLAEESLAAEQKRFLSGVSTVELVIQAQKDLAADSDSEVQAMANYAHAQIVFDLAMGRTLEENHISMKEAEAGRVERESAIPNKLPEIKTPEVKGDAR